MNRTWRLSILGLCTLQGVGLAVYVALAAPQPDAKTQGTRPVPAQDVALDASGPDGTAREVTSQLDISSPPLASDTVTASEDSPLDHVTDEPAVFQPLTETAAIRATTNAEASSQATLDAPQPLPPVDLPAGEQVSTELEGELTALPLLDPSAAASPQIETTHAPPVADRNAAARVEARALSRHRDIDEQLTAMLRHPRHAPRAAPQHPAREAIDQDGPSQLQLPEGERIAPLAEEPATSVAAEPPPGELIAQAEPSLPLSALKELVEVLRPAVEPPRPPQVEDAPPVERPLTPVEQPTGPSPSTPAEIRSVEAGAAPNAIDGEGDERLHIVIPEQDIRKVLQLLSEQSGSNILTSPNVRGTVSAVLHDVTVDGALEAILKSHGYVSRREGNFIYVGTQDDFIAFDRNYDPVGTRVYRPNYVTAAELQALILPLLSDIGKAKTSASTPSQVGIPSDQYAAGGNDFAGGDTLLVQDYESLLFEIDQVVQEVDQRPLQVAIEAMILSVQLDDEHRFGLDWELFRKQDTLRFTIGTPPTVVNRTTPASNGGLMFAFLDSNLAAFLEAVEKVGDTTIIATPQLMCLNKQRSEIHIGRELGYISTTTTETSTSQNVEFLEVGTQLRMRPFISRDGMVRLEIHPELSTGQVKTESGQTVPEKEVTQVTTNIMVHDGETIVIGGLLREDLITSATQVPLLGSLPLVGPLFREKDQEVIRSELVILVTPRIVREPDAYAQGAYTAMEFHRRQQVNADEMSPIAKRFLARKYFRRAQNAWASGNRMAAQRFIEMSIAIDPLNRAAIDLRADLWEGRVDGDHNGSRDVEPGPPPGMLVDPDRGNWLPQDIGPPPGVELPPLTSRRTRATRRDRN